MCHPNRPTFKTATPTSRTQLKQQLQREQLQELERQELERRENEQKLSMQQAVGMSNMDHCQMAHSSQTQTHPQQLQVPRNHNGIPNLYTSSPTPSTSTEGSDFTSGHYSNQSNQMQHTEHSNAPLKVPLHIGVDLPPQVLKVCVNLITFEWFEIELMMAGVCRFELSWRIRHGITWSKSKKIRCDNI